VLASERKGDGRQEREEDAGSGWVPRIVKGRRMERVLVGMQSKSSFLSFIPKGAQAGGLFL